MSVTSHSASIQKFTNGFLDNQYTRATLPSAFRTTKEEVAKAARGLKVNTCAAACHAALAGVGFAGTIGMIIVLVYTGVPSYLTAMTLACSVPISLVAIKACRSMAYVQQYSHQVKKDNTARLTALAVEELFQKELEAIDQEQLDEDERHAQVQSAHQANMQGLVEMLIIKP